MSSSSSRPPPLPIRYNVDKGYHDFLANQYGIDSKTGGPTDPTKDTQKGHQLTGTNNLHEAALRLADGEQLLHKNLQIVMDESSSKKARKVAADTIKKLGSLMTVASSVSSEAANVVSPIAATKVAHKRLDTMHAKQVRKANKAKPARALTVDPRVEMIDKFVATGGTASKPSPNQVSPPKQTVLGHSKRKRLPTRANAIPDPPAPANGKSEYGVGEFLQIMHAVPKKKRRKVLMKMKSDKFRYVPVHEATVYRLYEAAWVRGERFAFDEEWREGAGRPPRISNSRLEQCAGKLSTCAGMKEMKDKVNEILLDEERNKGFMPEAGKKVNGTTVNTYMAVFASINDRLTISDCSIAKSNNRFTTENSLIEAVCYLTVVALTHFYVADSEDVAWRKTLREIPEDDQLLYRIVCKFYGDKPVRPRPSWAIFNSDDTGEKATLGEQPDFSNQVGVVAKSSLLSKGTKSLFHVERSKQMNVRRCKRHFISNGSGECAPAVWSFRCSASEMPINDFIVWEVPGLCIGGFGVSGSTKPGYVIFYRDNVKGQEKKRFRWIRENIFFPFVSAVRKQHGFDDTTGAPIPEEFRVVSWCDGDNSQLATITEEEGIQAYSNHGVIQNKHGASGSAVQQSCDLSANFTSSKSLNKKTTIVHIPSDKHGLKESLEMQFRKEEKAGTLFLDKKSNVVDYLGKQPPNLTECCMPKKIIKGFRASGQLDATKEVMATFQGCIGSCKTPPKPHQYDLVIRLLLKLMAHSFHNGLQYIDDTYLISLGLPVTLDAEGKPQIKTQGISQECQQRAKCLTGPAEVAKRAKRLEMIEQQKKRRNEAATALAEQKRAEDLAIVQSLCTAAGKEPNPANLVHCTLANFASLTADPLRYFVAARHPTMKTKSATSSLKKPRTALQDAEAGVVNLVFVAHQVRMEKSRLLVEVGGDEGENESTEQAVPIALPSITRVQVCRIEEDVKPSSILTEPSKLGLLIKMMDPRDILLKADGFDDRPVLPETHQLLLDKADLLASTLRVRLLDHIEKRVVPDKRSHWCWAWARKNLSIVAAYMVYFDQVKKDIRCLDKYDCLLAKPVDVMKRASSGVASSESEESSSEHQTKQRFATVSEQTKPLYGAYLHYDTNKEVWIRSGSATGQGGFGSRLGTHEKRAKQDRNDDNSLFYHLYPHSDSVRAKSRGLQGRFDYLEAWIGAYFTADAAHTTDVSNGGLFLFTDDEKEKIKRANIRGKDGEWKFLLMIAYLFELGYDLAISPKDNVSESPIFEALGVIFENRWRRAQAETGAEAEAAAAGAGAEAAAAEAEAAAA